MSIIRKEGVNAMSLGLSVEEFEYLREAQVGIENALRSHLSDYVEPLKLKCKDCYGGCKGTCDGSRKSE